MALFTREFTSSMMGTSSSRIKFLQGGNFVLHILSQEFFSQKYWYPLMSQKSIEVYMFGIPNIVKFLVSSHKLGSILQNSTLKNSQEREILGSVLYEKKGWLIFSIFDTGKHIHIDRTIAKLLDSRDALFR